jgi:predicted nucleotidyltransferase
MTTETFLRSIQEWANDESGIEAVGVVGSHARGTARPDSDIDLVILATTSDLYLDDNQWLGRFGDLQEVRNEHYGLVQSKRAFYSNGLEVEYAFATDRWFETNPIDDGTLKVVSDGCEILVDKNGRFSKLFEAVKVFRGTPLA